MDSTIPTIEVRNLDSRDLDKADRIVRVAFGTFLGLADPTKAFGDKDVLKSRLRHGDSTAIAAYIDGHLIGNNVVSRWGSFGFFGPLAVRPDFWDKGVAGKLMVPTIDLFSKWGTTHEGLFTFPNSPKHIGLYHKFGFHARFLTPVMVKSVSVSKNGGMDKFYSELNEPERASMLESCREITNSLYPGLDLTNEITAAYDGKLGDTVLLTIGSELEGFAVCHHGPNTEGGSGNCYVKFGAVRKEESGSANFSSLLSAIENYAARKQISRIEAGVNLARNEAFEKMLNKGYRTEFIGVAMHRPNQPAFNERKVFAIDDWR